MILFGNNAQWRATRIWKGGRGGCERTDNSPCITFLAQLTIRYHWLIQSAFKISEYENQNENRQQEIVLKICHTHAAKNQADPLLLA